jgi:hypothetical protein
MTQRDMAGFLGIDVKTIRNWRKHKPNLYKTLMKGFAFDEAVKNFQESYEKLEDSAERVREK